MDTPQPPNTGLQLVTMTARYLAVGAAGGLIERHVIPASAQGPFTDDLTAVLVVVVCWLWAALLKLMQRHHWLDALYADPPDTKRADPGTPPAAMISGLKPPAPKVVEVRVTADSEALKAAVAEAIRTTTTPPGAL